MKDVERRITNANLAAERDIQSAFGQNWTNLRRPTDIRGKFNLQSALLRWGEGSKKVIEHKMDALIENTQILRYLDTNSLTNIEH